jgi:hypothetical protein
VGWHRGRFHRHRILVHSGTGLTTPVANLPQVSTTPAVNLPLVPLGVVDTGGKFDTGVNYTGSKFFIVCKHNIYNFS